MPSLPRMQNGNALVSSTLAAGGIWSAGTHFSGLFRLSACFVHLEEGLKLETLRSPAAKELKSASSSVQHRVQGPTKLRRKEKLAEGNRNDNSDRRAIFGFP